LHADCTVNLSEDEVDNLSQVVLMLLLHLYNNKTNKHNIIFNSIYIKLNQVQIMRVTIDTILNQNLIDSTGVNVLQQTPVIVCLLKPYSYISVILA